MLESLFVLNTMLVFNSEKEKKLGLTTILFKAWQIFSPVTKWHSCDIASAPKKLYENN